MTAENETFLWQMKQVFTSVTFMGLTFLDQRNMYSLPICENELTAFIDAPSFFTHFTASTQSVCVLWSCITLRRDASLNTKLVDEHRKIIKLEKGEGGFCSQENYCK